MLAVLVVLGLIAIRTEVSLPAGITLESLSALGLIATAVAGAGPALVVLLAPIVVHAVTGRERLLRAGNLANVAAYGTYALVGAALLAVVAPDATSPTAFGWVLLVGLVQLLINWLIGPALYVTLWLGHTPRTALAVLADGVPAGAVMALLGATTVLLIPALGILALALFALIVLLPQSYLTYAARTRPVARLSSDVATRRYAHALAIQLGLSRTERRHLRDVLDAAARRRPTGEAVDYLHASSGGVGAPELDAQLITEWWNGHGGPIGLSAAAIPEAARVIAVAETWSALTARGSPQLSHSEALTHLDAAAGFRFDPVVVAAARAVVAQELVTVAEPAPEPRLHRLHVPGPLRRALAGS
ncbi:MAG TPA: HD domain-containing phosphohydrolase [Solirubrobacteraceae bacterium]|nr:HD domain-containing phosphohydrolase [Solirubrobacteraceae bacterium]